jgi:hypothetical protein
MPSIMQARFDEDAYPIGRFVLDRARALRMGRTELVRRLCYPDISKGHKALTVLLITGMAPPLIAKHLATALEVGQDLIDAILLATARQQHDEAREQILAREKAYRAAFRPHLRCETARTVPAAYFPGCTYRNRSTASSSRTRERGCMCRSERSIDQAGDPGSLPRPERTCTSFRDYRVLHFRLHAGVSGRLPPAVRYSGRSSRSDGIGSPPR